MKMEHNCPFCSWLFWRDSIDTVCTYVDVGVEFTGGEWTLIKPTVVRLVCYGVGRGLMGDASQ